MTGPKVTLADVEANVVNEHYFTAAQGVYGALPEHCGMTSFSDDAPEARLTFCVLVLKNGFAVTGESACVSSENFDPEIGRANARRRALDKVWELMGYELKSRLAANLQPKVTDEMVGRFLGWKLPQDFAPDCYVSFDKERAAEVLWPTGTNLLHAGQVKDMLNHVLGYTL